MMSKRQEPGAAAAAGTAVTRLILTLFRTHGSVLAAGEALVAPIGLTSARWQVVGALALAGVPMTVPSIAAAMGLTRQAVQKQVDLMSADGLVAIRDNPLHRRSRLIAITKTGSRLYARADRLQRVWARALAKGIAAVDLEAATSVLERIQARLAAGDAPRSRKSAEKRRANDANDRNGHGREPARADGNRAGRRRPRQHLSRAPRGRSPSA